MVALSPASGVVVHRAGADAEQAPDPERRLVPDREAVRGRRRPGAVYQRGAGRGLGGASDEPGGLGGDRGVGEGACSGSGAGGDRPVRCAPGNKEAAEIDREAKAEREEATPTVAPGLRLPDLDGVFILDTFHGEPELIDVPQNSGGLNTGTPHNVLRAAIPGSSAKQLITLEGYKAKVQLHVNQPGIYVSLGDGKDSKRMTRQARAR